MKRYNATYPTVLLKLILGFGICLCTSCSRSNEEEILENIPEFSKEPITFSTPDNWGDNSNKATTKGSIITDDDLNNFGVLAYYLPDDKYQGKWNNDATPNFMYKQLVERTDNKWTYSPIKY